LLTLYRDALYRVICYIELPFCCRGGGGGVYPSLSGGDGSCGVYPSLSGGGGAYPSLSGGGGVYPSLSGGATRRLLLLVISFTNYSYCFLFLLYFFLNFH
jgi:hypothetical protein